MMDQEHKDNSVLLVMPKPPGISDAESEAVDQAMAQQPTSAATRFNAPLTRETLTEYQEALLLRNAKRVLPEMFKSLRSRLKANDPKAAELISNMYSYTSRGAGVSIGVNLFQQNNGIGQTREDRKQEVYLESIIRKMDQEEQSKANIIDVEAD